MNEIINYCTEHPILVGATVVCLFAAVGIVCVVSKKAKAAKAQAEVAAAERRRQAEKQQTPQKPKTPREHTPNLPRENSDSTESVGEAKTYEVRTPEAKTPENKIVESGTTKKAKTQTTAKKATTSPTPQTKKQPTTKTQKSKNTPYKEKNMLLDELKDADNELDFYEEDETDRVARYSGKWIICRVVTDDKATPEEEMYFFELHASNGEKLLSSEEYTTYAGALRGIETHKANILRGNFKITLSKKGDYIFKLLSGKNLLLCMGEHYATRASCESAIESAKRFAKTAIVDENIQDHIVKVPPENDSEYLPLPDGYNGKWILNREIGIDGEPAYSFELFANNGEKLLSSEEYTTYAGAINGIETHKANIRQGNFRVTLTKRGDYIYKLLNRNGQLLCLGEHYKTKRRCLNAVESVKRFAEKSPVLTDPKVLEAAKTEQQNA